jgi:FOG: CBS domain
MTTVIDGGKLVGIISDGDLRRLLERQGQNGRNVLEMTAAGCMTRQPKTISPETYAATALDVMEQGKITSLVVVGQSNEVVGVVHLHDLWGTEVI